MIWMWCGVAIMNRQMGCLLANRLQGRPVVVKRKLDGAVDEYSVDHKIRKSHATAKPVKNLEAYT